VCKRASIRPGELVGTTLLALACAASDAAGSAPRATRSADRHVHGSGTLIVVLEADELTVRLESPIANLVGFEHTPQTPAERRAWDEALARLRAGGDEYFTPSRAARCSLVDTALEDPFEAHGDGEEHDGEDPGHDDPGHDHAEPDHAGHEHTGHADLQVQYRFSCARAERLRELEVGLFVAFEGLQQLEAVYVDRQHQFGATLSASSARLRWR
jgi:hypothetical protein